MANIYDQGSTVALQSSPPFTNALTSALIDPSTVKLVITKPDGTVLRYTYGVDAQVTRLSVGLYQCLVVADVAGTWQYHWYAPSSTITAASAQNWFTVSIDALV
jgi:hypothetical protein